MFGNHSNIRVVSYGYVTKGATPVVSAGNSQQLNIISYSAVNSSVSTSDIGLGCSITPSNWKVYGAGGTDITKNVQGGQSSTLIDTSTNSSFIVQSKRHFGYLIINVSQAQGGTPSFVFEYWNGTSWATLPMLQNPSFIATGTAYATFQAPSDWVQGNDGSVPNFSTITAGYCVRVRASTATSTAILATNVQVARWIAYRQAVGSKQNVQVIFGDRAYLLDALETLIPFFGVANSLNTVEVSYLNNP